MGVGVYPWSLNDMFLGCIDDLMVFNYNMTTAQVSLLYSLY